MLVLAAWLAGVVLAWTPGPAAAQDGQVTQQARYWVDSEGQATIADVVRLPAQSFGSMERPQAFALERGALWLRYDLPTLDATRRWYLLLEGPSYTNRATLYQQNSAGQWQTQQAGDLMPMSEWTRPDLVPTFALDARAGGSVWLRLENFPTTINPGLSLLNERQLESRRNRTLLLLGGYLGFGLLVLFLGWVHVRLYADRAFIAYVFYVGCMLGFQVSYTGLGALFLWPELPRWNDAAPAIFVLWLTASGIWFVREVSALYRHSRALNRFVMRWSLFGLLYPLAYFAFHGPVAFHVLNLYGFLSVLLSIGLCVWAWRKGEVYAGWAALGFAPLHLAYPFAALRAAGLMHDSALTQYAVLVGSAIEIPLLLYILHQRARDFSENRARMRALDSTDPLTGLPIAPVLQLRLGDALRRARRQRSHCGLVVVELNNHAELASEAGREVAERALVVAASQIRSLVRDIDTVCRITDNRFAVLMESPYRAEMLKIFAQHIVAKGLAQAPSLPRDRTLAYRVITIALPDWTLAEPPAEELDVQLMINRLNLALDQMDPRRVVLHLPLPQPQPHAKAPAAPAAAS